MSGSPSERFRLTHTGSFFGKRDPRPFLTALKQSGLDDVVVRFLGDFPARFADDAAAALQLRRDRRHIVQEDAMSRGKKMVRHRAAHRAKANESDIDHVTYSESMLS